MLDIATLIERHDALLAAWYREPPEAPPAAEGLEAELLRQLHINFAQWNLEDEVRRTDLADATLVALKRAIDRSNQRRNDTQERIDELVLAALPPADAARAELHSETLGMMLDRLTILALKIHHMAANAARTDDPGLAARCAGRLAVLREQRADLAAAADRLLADCRAGRRFFKLYRQFKMYNDPQLRPAAPPAETKVAPPRAADQAEAP